MDIPKLGELLDDQPPHQQQLIITQLKKLVDELYLSLHFSMPPEKLIQYVELNKKPGSIAQSSWGDHAALYIGKMHKNEVGIYTKELILGMLYYAMKNNPKHEKIRIIACQDIYLSLLEQIEGNDVIPFKEQHTTLSQSLPEIFGHENRDLADRIIIEQLARRHSNLFGYISYEGLLGLLTWKGLDYKNKIPEQVDSLDIAAFLYQLTYQYPSLKQQLCKLVPEELGSTMSPDNELWYYGLLEVACRIFDLKSGITQQGGIIRQKTFDAQIDFILDPASQQQIPELARLHEIGISSEHLGLSRRYFKNTAYVSSLKHLKKKQASAAKVDAMNIGSLLETTTSKATDISR